MLTRYSNQNIASKIKQFISDYGTNLAVASVGGVIGKPIAESAGWRSDDFSDDNFGLTMLAGAAACGALPVLFRHLLTLIDKNDLSASSIDYIIGIPLHSLLGALYAVAGNDIRNLQPSNDALRFSIAAGAVGTAISHVGFSLIPQIPKIDFAKLYKTHQIAVSWAGLSVLGIGDQEVYNAIPENMSATLYAILFAYTSHLAFTALAGELGYSFLPSNETDRISRNEYIARLVVPGLLIALATSYFMIKMNDLTTKNYKAPDLPIAVAGTIFSFMKGAGLYLLSGPEARTAPVISAAAGSAITYAGLTTMWHATRCKKTAPQLIENESEDQNDPNIARYTRLTA